MNTQKQLTQEERGWLSIMRLNRMFPGREWRRRFDLPLVAVTARWRSRKNAWGRFGGGWQWAVGFEAAGRTCILNLLVFSVRIVADGLTPRQRRLRERRRKLERRAAELRRCLDPAHLDEHGPTADEVEEMRGELAAIGEQLAELAPEDEI